MKNRKNRILLGLIAAAGLLRLADLFFNTDPATGFLTDGFVWLRYLVLALPVIAAFVISRMQKPQYLPGALPDTTLTFGYMVGAVGCIAGAVAAAVLFLIGQTGILVLLCYLLQAAGGAWLAALSRKKKSNVWLGMLLCVGTLGLTLNQFLTHSSTLFRIGNAVNLLSGLTAMLFLMRLVHLLEGGYQKKIERSVYFFGMTTFYLCCALFLPQQLWSLFSNAHLSAEICAESISLTGIGLLGFISAMRAGTLAGEKRYLHDGQKAADGEKGVGSDEAG